MGRARQLRKNGKGARRQDRPTLWYPLTAPDETVVYPIAPEGWEGRWVLSETTWREREAAGLTKWVKRKYGWVPYYIEIAPQEPATPWPTIWTEVDQNRQAKAEFTALMGRNVDFDNPKPTNLIVELLKVATIGDELCLDFFAGSCSTAHAVLRLNKEDGGDRKFIMIQLPELTPEDSAVHQGGFQTIAEVGKERIRRASAQLKEQPRLKVSDVSEDLGFKVFKLDRSHFKAWQDFAGDNLEELEDLFTTMETPLVDGWHEQDVLTEILLLEGFPINSKVTCATDFTANKVLEVESDFIGHRLFVCLEPRISDNTIERLAILPDEDIFICLDSSLDDAAKVRLSDVGNVRTI
jgi:adenine-specific DNA-methyltransferase